jgi:hypothetical protein
MTQDRPANEAGVVTKLSPRPVADTTARLTGMISAKGMKLFAVIDQAAEACQAGLELRDTTLVIFGSPAAGTPLMAAATPLPERVRSRRRVQPADLEDRRGDPQAGTGHGPRT